MSLTCLFSVARTCSVIFIVLDVLKPLQHKRLIEYELEGFGIRLNKKPPNIGFKKKDKGGLNLTSTVRYLYYTLKGNANEEIKIFENKKPLKL